MTDLQDFWLHLHRLSQAYGAMGSTVGEATEELLEQLQAKAPEAQREARDQILVMLTALEALHARIKA